MNLGERHNCETYNTTRYATTDIESMTLVREISAHAQEVMISAAKWALAFVETINHATRRADFLLSPWILRCVYQTATVVAWLGPSGLCYSDAECVAAKTSCIQLLGYASRAYAAAGECSLRCLVVAC
jgi:hypothetical protein